MSSQPAALKGIPQPGEVFGHYRLVRLLGRGGMGVVFEAEDLETGRRIALKILSQALDSPEARRRFLREGQIAASINHPHSVYVFGTEEIAGTPVIAMELMSGGTLRDRVAASGPMAAAGAVDAILQIIAGLEAAQQAGVLHRDIKPSNCFINSDGTIKIGDFGLSISTTVRTESNLTGASTLFGTPAFSSPEQLRGEELTMRSDIYSLGVTLYFLLTGRMPFEAPNLVQLLANVLEKRPESPGHWRLGIPNGLSHATLHCLQKDSSARFGSYAAFRRALQPYASSSPTPATLALRFAAYLVDMFLLNIPCGLAILFAFGGVSALTDPGHAGARLLASLVSFLVIVLYFGLFEGLRGASPGKLLCRLRVAGLNGELPGLRKGLLRALYYCGLTSLPAIALAGMDLTPARMTPVKTGLIYFLPAAVSLLIFCYCRRENGFAGLHDLWSRTRVLARVDLPVRPVLSPPSETPQLASDLPRIGPYHVLAELGQSDDATIMLGYDARLLRKVWLRRSPPAAPAVAGGLRHLARTGRLRWLNGKRSETESWDAYEAVAGQSLLELLSKRQAWAAIRFWLLDLAEELKAGEKDGSRPSVLSLDRVWITADGRAKLLDFPAPGSRLPNLDPPPRELSPQAFLRQTALSALEGRPLSVEQARASALELPLPLYVRSFFQRLESLPDAHAVWAQLKPLIGKPPVISRARRLAMLGISIAFPAFIAATQWASSYFISTKENAEILALHFCLTQGKLTTDTNSPTGVGGKTNRPLEIFIAERFRPIVTNPAAWSGRLANQLIQPDQKALVERLITAHPSIAPSEFAQAKTAVQSQFPMISTATTQPTSFFPSLSTMIPLIVYCITVVFIILPGFAAALMFRGGLAMRILGIAVVGPNGKPSRGRTFWRNLIAWLPFLLSPMIAKAVEEMSVKLWAPVIATGVLALLAGLSLMLRRSFQDQLAHSWLVPAGGAVEAEWNVGQTLSGGGQARRPWLPLAAVAGAFGLLLLLGQASSILLHPRKSSSPTTQPTITAGVRPKECVVLLPDGTPAAHAQVWFSTQKNASLSAYRPGEFYPNNMANIQVDAEGKFLLPAVTHDTRIIVSAPEGMFLASAEEVRSASSVRLQPLGRVEGLLLSEGKAKPDAPISIGLLSAQSGLHLSYSGTSGNDGRFIFTNLPAGDYRLYRNFFPRRRIEGGFSMLPSHQIIVTVKAGETTQAQWGGGGRPVVGHADSENPAITVDWPHGSHSLELAQSTAIGMKKFVRDSWGLGASSADALKQMREDRSYHLEFEADGSFRAEDVPPGNYELRIQVTKAKATGEDRSYYPEEVLGALKRAVTIPPGQGAYDVGGLIVPVKGEPAGALSFPMEASLATHDGQTLTLASLRGKNVVLVFWASWSETSKNTLASLLQVRDEFAANASVTFLAASLDDDAASFRQAAASMDYGFTLGRLPIGDRATVTDAFDIATLPEVYLLGPDGRVAARHLDAGKLRSLLLNKRP